MDQGTNVCFGLGVATFPSGCRTDRPRGLGSRRGPVPVRKDRALDRPTGPSTPREGSSASIESVPVLPKAYLFRGFGPIVTPSPLVTGPVPPRKFDIRETGGSSEGAWVSSVPGPPDVPPPKSVWDPGRRMPLTRLPSRCTGRGSRLSNRPHPPPGLPTHRDWYVSSDPLPSKVHVPDVPYLLFLWACDSVTGGTGVGVQEEFQDPGSKGTV